VLREIPEDGVSKLLSSKEALAACDIAVFVHDRYYLQKSLLVA
jgi:Ras family protein T1